MRLYKLIIRTFCKPPPSMKGDYRYIERKCLNVLILCQLCLSFAPAVISLFVNINYNPKRLLLIAPMYAMMLILMWFRAYRMLTGCLIISGIIVKYNYWTSVDRGIVFSSPFFALIFTATLIPSKRFLAFVYVLTFSVSYFFIEGRFCEFLLTAPREELVDVFQKSFTSMLMIFSMSFCHLLVGRYMQEKICGKQLALKTTVALQNQELQKMNQDLTKALESRDSFILSFSHETRNPLNGIMGNLHLLSDVEVCPKAKMYLQRANICAKILNNILLTILDSRRTGQSAVDIILKPQQIDMAVFIQEIWTLCREIIRTKAITPILEVSPRFPRWLVFDPERITQVAMNLVSNAMKFTQKGYIRLSFDWKPENEGAVDRRNETVFFTSLGKQRGNEGGKDYNCGYNSDWFHKPQREEKGSLVISVEDTGCGIKKEHQKIIFEKFSQVTADAELKSLGLGLGLWIAKTIIKLHGGEITLKSEEGVGSCFTGTVATVANPYEGEKRSMKQLESTEKPHLEYKQSMLRALIVEDSPINQKIHSELLKKCGFTHIEVAADGQEGVSLFKKRGKNYFDLVTMDLEMPVMKGKKAITLMREWETDIGARPTKIIVISGNAVDKEVNECLDPKGDIRADAFLTKPCSYKTLTDTLLKLKASPNRSIEVRGTSGSIVSMEKRPKILLADDDYFNIDVLIAYAERMNLKYVVARDGVEAYDIFEAQGESIDMVLLDYSMPVMKGPEASEKIRKKISGKRKCPIYLLSGMDRVTDEEAKKFDGIIQKPLTFEKFDEVVSGAL